MFPIAAADYPAETITPSSLQVYIGTYTGPRSQGIYHFRLDRATGATTPPELAAETTNPSFLAVEPGGRFLFAVNEIGDFQGKESGAVSAFRIESGNGRLSLLNQQPSGGSGPCFVSVAPQTRRVLVANYGSGSVAALPYGMDGKLSPPSGVVQHEGSSVHPKRQTKPHAHSILPEPEEKFVLAADLGIDRVLVYRLNAAGRLEPGDPPAVTVRPGSGPRHIAFHPTGKFVYVVNEMVNTVTAFAHGENAALSEFQITSTLPADYHGESTAAEIRVHPSGRFLLASNRGHDSIAIFRIDPATGKLDLQGHEPSGGKTPRGFSLDPTGNWLLVANQNSDNVLVFRIDLESGRLSKAGEVTGIGSPVCVTLLPTTNEIP